MKRCLLCVAAAAVLVAPAPARATVWFHLVFRDARGPTRRTVRVTSWAVDMRTGEPTLDFRLKASAAGPVRILGSVAYGGSVQYAKPGLPAAGCRQQAPDVRGPMWTQTTARWRGRCWCIEVDPVGAGGPLYMAEQGEYDTSLPIRVYPTRPPVAVRRAVRIRAAAKDEAPSLHLTWRDGKPVAGARVAVCVSPGSNLLSRRTRCAAAYRLGRKGTMPFRLPRCPKGWVCVAYVYGTPGGRPVYVRVPSTDGPYLALGSP